jgi:hypothetical protein
VQVGGCVFFNWKDPYAPTPPIGGLFVPKHLDVEETRAGICLPRKRPGANRGGFLNDASVGEIAGIRYIFNQRSTLDDVTKIFQKYHPILLVTFFARITAYLAHHGVRPCTDDGVQRDVRRGMITAGLAKGWKIEGESAARKEVDLPAFSFETLALLAGDDRCIQLCKYTMVTPSPPSEASPGRN